MLLTVLFLSGLFLAYTNGANDNFKGVATLYGSATLNYNQAITIASLTTFAGSLSAIFLADSLIANFSGKGLVPNNLVGNPGFLFSVAFSAACTVFIASKIGFPISTTHGLIGGLVGAGFIAAGSDLNINLLGNKFFLPLLLSPLLALVMGIAFYLIFHSVRVRLKLNKEQCICIGEKVSVTPLALPNSLVNFESNKTLDVHINSQAQCYERYTGNFIGIKLNDFLDWMHIGSGATVCFARGLNDTPKIMGLMLAIDLLNVQFGLLLIGLGMMLGGFLGAKKIAITISKKITPMNSGQGFAANFVTGLLVIFASKFGMPVSTTHVSIGSIFGIGLISGKGETSVMFQILLSWLLTLPVAAVIAGSVYYSQLLIFS